MNSTQKQILKALIQSGNKEAALSFVDNHSIDTLDDLQDADSDNGQTPILSDALKIVKDDKKQSKIN